jgi:ribosomal protein S18 acetylase RimI-like enzyme
MELIIRRASLPDATRLAEFNQQLAWETERKQLDATVLAAGIHAVLTDPHKGFYIVAERAGDVVGQTLITYEWSDWRNGWFWWVQSVYVQAAARNSGVFRALFEYLLVQAQADPTVIGLRLYVERQNTAAQNAYHRLGMTDTPYDLLEFYPLPSRPRHLA